jgi:hypothetical protein
MQTGSFFPEESVGRLSSSRRCVTTLVPFVSDRRNLRPSNQCEDPFVAEQRSSGLRLKDRDEWMSKDFDI